MPGQCVGSRRLNWDCQGKQRGVIGQLIAVVTIPTWFVASRRLWAQTELCHGASSKVIFKGKGRWWVPSYGRWNIGWKVGSVDPGGRKRRNSCEVGEDLCEGWCSTCSRRRSTNWRWNPRDRSCSASRGYCGDGWGESKVDGGPVAWATRRSSEGCWGSTRWTSPTNSGWGEATWVLAAAAATWWCTCTSGTSRWSRNCSSTWWGSTWLSAWGTRWGRWWTRRSKNRRMWWKPVGPFSSTSCRSCSTTSWSTTSRSTSRSSTTRGTSSTFWTCSTRSWFWSHHHVHQKSMCFGVKR